jgi:hypothetical protein
LIAIASAIMQSNFTFARGIAITQASQQAEREYAGLDVAHQPPDVLGKGVPGPRPLGRLDHGPAFGHRDRVLGQRPPEPAREVRIQLR